MDRLRQYRPFRTLLIANRGEIACRVIRTAKVMGLRTVAVYSEADRGAMHVELADEAVLLGPPRARDSYLDIARVIEAARQTGAEAIHPGYGFLSESAEFAQACLDAGLVFVGPTAAMIRAMGSKSGSKLLMAGTDFALALPRVVILLLLATLWAPGALLVIIVLGVTGWMPIARLVHGEVRRIMAGSYVDGAVALGARRSRVLLRHVLPNAMTPVIAAAALGVGNAISLEAGLSFLGLGVQPPAPSWGSMIASGRDALINAPWVALAPGLALILVVVACTLLGDGWRGPGHRGQRELTL